MVDTPKHKYQQINQAIRTLRLNSDEYWKNGSGPAGNELIIEMPTPETNLLLKRERQPDLTWRYTIYSGEEVRGRDLPARDLLFFISKTFNSPENIKKEGSRLGHDSFSSTTHARSTLRASTAAQPEPAAAEYIDAIPKYPYQAVNVAIRTLKLTLDKYWRKENGAVGNELIIGMPNAETSLLLKRTKHDGVWRYDIFCGEEVKGESLRAPQLLSIISQTFNLPANLKAEGSRFDFPVKEPTPANRPAPMPLRQISGAVHDPAPVAPAQPSSPAHAPSP